MTPQVFAIGSTSIASWLPEFLPLGIQPTVVVPVHIDDLSTTVDSSADREVVLVSDHSTLPRDREWATQLARRGVRARCQSATAVAWAMDKVTMKRMLDQADVPTLPWRSADEVSPLWRQDGAPVVCKQRGGTQSEGIRIGCAADVPGADEYCEPYYDGVEYSVNVFATGTRVVALPPIWKGSTSPDLVPPWRRTRICAPFVVPADLAGVLEHISRRIALLSEADGFIEVEFLVTEDGKPYVLEVNPRVSGTLRMSALAADQRVFGWYRRPPAIQGYPPVAYAVEVPNAGSPRMLRDWGVYATSRLTVVGSDPAELGRRIRRAVRSGLVSGSAADLLADALTRLSGSPPALATGSA
jgi:hypothetical protein